MPNTTGGTFDAVFWIEDPGFLVVGAGAAAITVPLFEVGAVQTLHNMRLDDISGAAGMALLVMTGTNVALSVGADPVSAAIVGVISGVGGMIRDVLVNQILSALKSGHLYATAAFAGALLYALLPELSVSPIVAMWFPVFSIFMIRILSLKYGWVYPSSTLGQRKFGKYFHQQLSELEKRFGLLNAVKRRCPSPVVRLSRFRPRCLPSPLHCCGPSR